MSEKMIRGLMFLIAGFTPLVVYLGLGPIAMKTKKFEKDSLPI